MRFLQATLLLSAILMTWANQIDDDVRDTPPLSEALYIFEVKSDAPLDEIKGSLSSVQSLVRHSFQVIGERRFYFVVVNDQSDAVRNVAFPTGSDVTQYPVEHAQDFAKLFNVTDWSENDTTTALKPKDLHVVIWDFDVQGGLSVEDYTTTMTKMTEAFKGTPNPMNSATYGVVGRFPSKIIRFANLEDNARQKATLDAFMMFGDLGRYTLLHLRLID